MEIFKHIALNIMITFQVIKKVKYKLIGSLNKLSFRVINVINIAPIRQTPSFQEHSHWQHVVDCSDPVINKLQLTFFIWGAGMERVKGTPATKTVD